MSIFPKRTVRGNNVTIHWNFNISHLTDVCVFPFVRIGVIDPNGHTTMLFEDHVLGLPDPPTLPEDVPDKRLKYLNKNLPLMIVSEYLSGRATMERLVDILKNIQSGRHYYFTFHVPEDAPLGKYTLLSEVHSQGQVRHSKTATDDFFFVEYVSNTIDNSSGKKELVVTNHSSEKTPVKIIDVTTLEDGKVRTELRLFEMEPHQEKRLQPLAPISFLSYNEERVNMPFSEDQNKQYLLRNQQVLELDKSTGQKFLFKNEDESSYELDSKTKPIWEKANGLQDLETDKTIDKEVLKEFLSENLLNTITYPK